MIGCDNLDCPYQWVSARFLTRFYPKIQLFVGYDPPCLFFFAVIIGRFGRPQQYTRLPPIGLNLVLMPLGIFFFLFAPRFLRFVSV
jgi:hypothetical protein